MKDSGVGTSTVAEESWVRLWTISRKLHTYLQKVVAPFLQNYVAIDDIVSDAVCYAQQHPEQWVKIPDKELIYYLRRIARLMVYDHYRKYKVRVSRQSNEPVSQVNLPEPDGRKNPSPAKIIHKAEKAGAMEKIFDRLSKPDYRQVLRLVWLNGMTVNQAAGRMGRTESSTQALLFRAMQACRGIARRESFAGFRISGETQ